MIVLINSSKTMASERYAVDLPHTIPEFIDRAQKLVTELNRLPETMLGRVLGVSRNLARLNADRYRAWQTPFRPENSRQALLAFAGDIFDRLRAREFRPSDFEFAQRRLRILSGLYGILRPLDLIQPYRLEMGTELKPLRIDLYEYWGGMIAEALKQALKQTRSDTLLDLASMEYFKSVRSAELPVRIVRPVFKEFKDGIYRSVAVYTKRARGAMCRYVMTRGITAVEKVVKFDADGYRLADELSSADEWVFVRGEKTRE
jgi:cytoplasmic iron level regulating protein YaaA (DUF328/UPF0246 family)